MINDPSLIYSLELNIPCSSIVFGLILVCAYIFPVYHDYLLFCFSSISPQFSDILSVRSSRFSLLFDLMFSLVRFPITQLIISSFYLRLVRLLILFPFVLMIVNILTFVHFTKMSAVSFDCRSDNPHFSGREKEKKSIELKPTDRHALLLMTE